MKILCRSDWDKWSNCLSETPCPIRRRGEWDEPEGPSLPPVLFYAKETELRELETRRLRVEQLQQAVKLHQVRNKPLLLTCAWFFIGLIGLNL